MCTAITYQTKDHYFGRNLDLDYVYQETVTITPRRYPLRFRQMGTLDRHYAMIGMAYVLGDYPLYYDATNQLPRQRRVPAGGARSGQRHSL